MPTVITGRLAATLQESDLMSKMREAEAESMRPSTRINPVVFYASVTCIIAIALWAIISPEGAAATIGNLVGRISEWFGWFYILVATAFLAYVVFLVLSRYDKTSLESMSTPSPSLASSSGPRCCSPPASARQAGSCGGDAYSPCVLERTFQNL